MNKIITAGCVALAATAALAMPNKQELAKAKPLVEAQTKADLTAYKAGNMTAKNVADSHVLLAQKAGSQAEKYLLYQGAFKLYARSGEYDLAADAIQIMKREVKDVPPEVIAEIVGDELRYVSDDKAPRLVAMLKEAKGAVNTDRKLKTKGVKNRDTVQSIIDGMIKVPGRDCWLSETELTQGQWEAVMGNNPSEHKGVNLPVECVSMNDAVAFIEKLNSCPEAKSWGKRFSLPGIVDWLCAVSHWGVATYEERCWIAENSGGMTHEVATKKPNAYGFYDMQGNVWEWMDGSANAKGARRGGCYADDIDGCRINHWINTPRGRRYGCCGMRVAAYLPEKEAAEEKNKSPYCTRNGLLCTKDGLRLVVGANGDVKIPEGVVGIEEDAFQDFRGLNTVAIPSSVTWVKGEMFIGCTALTSFHVAADNPYYKSENGCLLTKDGKTLVCGVNGDVTIPSGVTSIGPCAFKFHTTLKSIVIPHSVTNIDQSAFEGCFNLEAVMLPSGLKNIGPLAFQWCRKLQSVTIPSGVPSIAPQAFYQCNELENVTINPGVANIGRSAFEDCQHLKSVEIPDGVKIIGEYAFKLCRNLSSAAIPSSVTNIGTQAFLGCIDLKDVTIPSGVKSIEPNTFQYCSRLRSLTILPGVKNIGYQAFHDCGQLENVTIPPSVTNIAQWAFRECALKTLMIPAGVRGIGLAPFDGCKEMMSFSVDENNPLYSSRNGLICSKDGSTLVVGVNGDVAIPTCVKNIAQTSFQGCHRINSVTIPSSVTNIGDSAFCWCATLRSVTMLGERPTVSGNPFVRCGSIKAIHVPANAKSWAGMKEWQDKKLVFDAKAENAK